MSRALTRAAVLVSLTWLAVGWAVGGCDERVRRPSGGGEGTTAPSTRDVGPDGVAGTRPAGTRPAGDATERTQPKPGYARGRVLGQNGVPVALPGARIAINLRGISHEGGRRIDTYREIAGADGTFEFALEPGMYRPLEAFIEVPFNNRQYRFHLHPVHDSFGQGQESGQGIAQDFEWRLSGLRPKQPADPARPESWYGASILMRFIPYREDLKVSVPSAPNGTKVTITLTPITPLADGTNGRELTFERIYGGGIGLEQPYLTDIPLAKYSLVGKEVFPDGQTGKLLILGENGAWGDKAEGTFGSDLQAKGVEQVIVRFSRPIE
jgi:hypothetical protein